MSPGVPSKNVVRVVRLALTVIMFYHPVTGRVKVGLSLSKTPSELESTAQKAKMLCEVIKEELDVCELDEGTCVCW
ncbi:MAG: hypothetical protein JW795_00855 [Chitinivibrionales bacterium]|nr:hypothetical protein [Chitinivibrionales bacterium]